MARHAPGRQEHRGPGGAGAGRGRLAWRQFTADPWVSLGLALLVGLVALLLTAVPRALVDVQSRQLVQDVTGLSAVQRDVIGEWGRTVEVASLSTLDAELLGTSEEEHARLVEDAWAPFREGAEKIRQAQPQPLRGVLAPAQMVTLLQTTVTTTPPVGTGIAEVTYAAAVDPDLTGHVEIVEGDWPGLGAAANTVLGVPAREEDERDPAAPAQDEGIPVLVSQDAAEQLQLEVGQSLGSGPLVLSGTYRPVDAEDPRWQHIDNAATLGLIPDPDRGTTAFATVFLSPQNRGSTGQPASVRTRLWYPVDPAGIAGRTDEVAQLRTQLTGFLAQQYTVATAAELGVPWEQTDQIPVFTTELTSTLDRVVGQQRATSSLLAVIAAGPLGVALAVAALAARLVVHRRRPALTMALARGASPAQLRWLVAAEGLLLGLPAAALGHLAAMLLAPGPTPWWQWLVTGVIALVPSTALAASLDDASLRQTRSDLSGRSRSRWRWVVEVSVLALAAVATWRLLDRGARGDDAADSGIDLLAAGTPVLLALAACVVALRLYPVPLAALTAGLHGRASLTPFLGAARALRDPAGGLVPALAVVLGTAIALVSAVLLTTITRGAETAAWDGNGAAVRLSGPVLTEEARARLGDIEGVTAVAGLADSGQTARLTTDDGERHSVRVWVVDGDLQQVQAETPVTGLPDALYAPEGPPGIVALRGLDLPGDARLTLSRLDEVRLVGATPRLPGADHASGVVVDTARWREGGPGTLTPRITLIGIADDADPRQVAQTVRAEAGSGVVTTVDERLREFTDAPVTRGLTALFVGATGVSALLTVLAVVAVQLMGSVARARLLSVLRTLGLAPGQTRALTAWELAPLLVVSVLVGGVLGLAVPWLLLRGLDLSGLTGGHVQPSLVLDPVVVALVLGAVVLTVLIAVTVSAWLSGRTNLAQALRVGEER